MSGVSYGRFQISRRRETTTMENRSPSWKIGVRRVSSRVVCLLQSVASLVESLVESSGKSTGKLIYAEPEPTRAVLEWL